MEIKGILFDKDGTLLRFKEIWIQIANEVIEELLTSIEEKENETLKEKLFDSIGLRNGEVDEKGILASGTSLDIATAFKRVLPKDIPHLHHWLSEGFLNKTRDNIDRVKPVGNLHLLFSTLKDKGVIVGIVTADDYETTKLCLQQLGIENTVQFIGTSDLYKKKPNPEMVEEFCKKFRLKREEVAIVGDTVVDMQFAKNSNVRYGIGVMSGVGSYEELSQLAHYVLPSVEYLIDPNDNFIWDKKNRNVLSLKGEKTKLVFPVISDVHINSDDNVKLEKFITTLEQLNQVAPNQDAFVVVGDLTDSGTISEYDKFMSAYNTRKQPKAVSLMAIGNHDYWNELSVEEAQDRFLGKTGMQSIYYHKVIKGYHFIILGTEDGITEGTFSLKQNEWLAEQLRIANADDPNKPIFVFHHQPMLNTMYGSEWGFSENRDVFYNTLKEYPQVIAFSGHTHYPLDDPRIIHQKDFTSIGTSTGAYLWLDSGRVQGEVPEGADIVNQALIVEVFDNKVLLHRRDIHKNDWTGDPFEILYPANKRKFYYTELRDKKAPYFKPGSMLSIDHENITASSLTIMFTQAKDNLLVHDYKVVVKKAETGEEVKQFLAFSEFYKDPVPNPLTLPINDLQPNTLYGIEVFALDAYGNVSTNLLKVLGRTLESGVEDASIISRNEINSPN